MGELRDAAVIGEERKEAVMDPANALEHLRQLADPALRELDGEGERITRAWLSYEQLDVEEATTFGAEVAASTMVAIRAGMPVQEALASLWMDGVMTGLIVARQRAEAES